MDTLQFITSLSPGRLWCCWPSGDKRKAGRSRMSHCSFAVKICALAITTWSMLHFYGLLLLGYSWSRWASRFSRIARTTRTRAVCWGIMNGQIDAINGRMENEGGKDRWINCVMYRAFSFATTVILLKMFPSPSLSRPFLSFSLLPPSPLSLLSFVLQNIQQQLGNGGKGPLNQLPGPVPLPVGQPGSPGPPGPEGPAGQYVGYCVLTSLFLWIIAECLYPLIFSCDIFPGSRGVPWRPWAYWKPRTPCKMSYCYHSNIVIITTCYLLP